MTKEMFCRVYQIIRIIFLLAALYFLPDDVIYFLKKYIGNKFFSGMILLLAFIGLSTFCAYVVTGFLSFILRLTRYFIKIFNEYFKAVLLSVNQPIFLITQVMLMAFFFAFYNDLYFYFIKFIGDDRLYKVVFALILICLSFFIAIIISLFVEVLFHLIRYFYGLLKSLYNATVKITHNPMFLVTQVVITAIFFNFFSHKYLLMMRYIDNNLLAGGILAVTLIGGSIFLSYIMTDYLNVLSRLMARMWKLFKRLLVALSIIVKQPLFIIAQYILLMAFCGLLTDFYVSYLKVYFDNSLHITLVVMFALIATSFVASLMVYAVLKPLVKQSSENDT